MNINRTAGARVCVFSSSPYTPRNDPRRPSSTTNERVHVKYTLTELEMIHAATIGIARSAHAITKGWLHKHGFEGLGFNESIAGAIGEYVAATILDLEWKPKIGDPSPGDIGDNTEVRTTVRKPKDKSARRLLIHDDDPSFEGRDLSSLRTGIMAGSPCPIEVMNRVVEEMGVEEIAIAYGLTEASPAVTLTDVNDPVELRVTSPDGNKVQGWPINNT